MEKSTNTNELAARGWGERLTSLIVALLVVLSVTGLWIYLAPFSVAAHNQVLLHRAVGLFTLGPSVDCRPST